MAETGEHERIDEMSKNKLKKKTKSELIKLLLNCKRSNDVLKIQYNILKTFISQEQGRINKKDKEIAELKRLLKEAYNDGNAMFYKLREFKILEACDHCINYENKYKLCGKDLKCCWRLENEIRQALCLSDEQQPPGKDYKE